MVFVTCGMGGGTGTGAAPGRGRSWRGRPGALTVGIVTKPFLFEGRKRMRQAEQGIAEMRKNVDTMIVVPNERLLAVVGKGIPFQDALKKADEVLLHATQGIASLITVTGLVNVDFADVRTVMQNGGSALMGTGIGRGENRAMEAAQQAISSPLLDNVSHRRRHRRAHQHHRRRRPHARRVHPDQRDHPRRRRRRRRDHLRRRQRPGDAGRDPRHGHRDRLRPRRSPAISRSAGPPARPACSTSRSGSGAPRRRYAAPGRPGQPRRVPAPRLQPGAGRPARPKCPRWRSPPSSGGRWTDAAAPAGRCRRWSSCAAAVFATTGAGPGAGCPRRRRRPPSPGRGRARRHRDPRHAAAGETLSELFARHGIVGLDLAGLDPALSLDPRRLRARARVQLPPHRRRHRCPTAISVRTSPGAAGRLPARRATAGTPTVEPIAWTRRARSGSKAPSTTRSTRRSTRRWRDDQLDGADRQRLAWDLADVYAWQVDFTRDIQPGDRFQVVLRAPGLRGRRDALRPGARERPHDVRQEPDRVPLRGATASAAFYDADGNSLRRAFLRAPVAVPPHLLQLRPCPVPSGARASPAGTRAPTTPRRPARR